ncbi:hypothetical protein H5410_056629 [Solanum commersonii]|uniref:Uncharacterized protein n=1 Tax=Solanum commersonii TaxID=4109 RepID=A0A9J5WMS1_SOLCO|nr:hypothetical protein H5410_056629 [Solanum commersonii]
MAPGGRVYKQKTLTGQTVSSAQSTDESNKCTRATATDDTASFKRGRGKTRGKGLEKMKRALGKKMVIEIPIWKRETVKAEKFEINLDEHYVKDSCEDILKNRSRQWHYKLKKMFESALSEEVARKIEVPELTPENWNRLCDMWSNPEHKNNMIDLKALYTSGESSMTIDEIVDAILGKKSGYIKGLGYGPKPNTNRATQRRTTELEDSLERRRRKALVSNLVQKQLDALKLL